VVASGLGELPELAEAAPSFVVIDSIVVFSGHAAGVGGSGLVEGITIAESNTAEPAAC
jgi:hypothetical protein